MAPLFKVTLDGSLNETFYVRAETEDFARDIAIEHVLDDPLGFFMPFDDVEEADEGEVDEDEVLS